MSRCPDVDMRTVSIEKVKHWMFLKPAEVAMTLVMELFVSIVCSLQISC